MRYFEYSVFDSNEYNAIGNPSSVFVFDKKEEGSLSEAKKSKLAIEAGSPISCFVNLQKDSKQADIEFFAPNGKKEPICFHGTVSVVKMVQDRFPLIEKLFISSYGYVDFFYNQNKIGIAYKNETEISPFRDRQFFDEMIQLCSFSRDDILEMNCNYKTSDIVCEVKDHTALTGLSLTTENKEHLRALIQKYNKRALMFFALRPGQENCTQEIVSRIFYINLKGLEDICCGSANLSFASILNKKYGICEYKNIQPFSFSETSKNGGVQNVLYNTSSKEIQLIGHVSQVEKKINVTKIELDNKIENLAAYEDSLLRGTQINNTNIEYFNRTV